MPSHSMIARYIILIESVFVQWVGSGSFKKSDFSAVIFLILGNRQSASLPSLWTSGIGSAVHNVAKALMYEHWKVKKVLGYKTGITIYS